MRFTISDMNGIKFINEVVMQHESEISAMIEHIGQENIKDIIEIGTFEGGTAYIWAQLAKKNDGHVYCIDVQFGSDKPRSVFVTPAAN